MLVLIKKHVKFGIISECAAWTLGLEDVENRLMQYLCQLKRAGYESDRWEMPGAVSGTRECMEGMKCFNANIFEKYYL